tara:strand:- start:8247 stop:9227 length:981 start_codon:yes stop_codon:yes gene_type:complete
MSVNIAIIGAGNIGSRHLQSLQKVDLNLNIMVIDPDSKSLGISKKRFSQVKSSKTKKTVSYNQRIDSIKNKVDLAIVATNADIRRNVIEQIIQKVSVKYFILEKVVFQSNKDFKDIITLFKKNKIKAWVNCTRRIMPLYTKIMEKLSGTGRVFMSVEGGGWSMSCNGIHFIDLFSFITNNNKLSLDGSRLGISSFKNKRGDYIECNGMLTGSLTDGSVLNLIEYPDSKYSTIIIINGSKSRYIIFESMGTVIEAHKENNFNWQNNSFQKIVISNVMNSQVQKIINTGNCDLTTLEDSFLLHKPLLKSFTDQIFKQHGISYKKCPIT